MQNNKRLYFVTNTKMSKGIKESIHFFQELSKKVKDLEDREIEIALILPYVVLYALRSDARESQVLLGAQNVCGEQEISYTGEISI